MYSIVMLNFSVRINFGTLIFAFAALVSVFASDLVLLVLIFLSRSGWR